MSELPSYNPEAVSSRPQDRAPAIGSAVLNTIPTGAKEQKLTPNGLCPAYMAQQRKLLELARSAEA